MVIIYALTLFISAFLLFWVQLWVGKLLLPLLGGAPGVWNTCMVFFQALLLLGYSYAHVLSTRLKFSYSQVDRDITTPEKEQGKTASHWVIMARNKESLGTLITDFPWQNMVAKSTSASKLKVWTDDFSDIWQVLRLDDFDRETN